MKQIILKSVIMVLVSLFSLNTYADKIQIDGIYYYLNDYNKTAKVVESSTSFDEKYKGDITIPASVQYGGITYKVTSIDNGAFYQCSSLNSLIIPEGVTSIGENAFWESGLKMITIPSSVTSIGSMAFWSCRCSKIYISDLEAWLKIPRSTNTPKYAYTLYLNGEILTDVIIPSSITTIKEQTFSHCISIESVVIPSSVTSIGGYAFWDCTGLTSLTIPSSVTSIGSYAFKGCTGLPSITVNNGITSIAEGTFEACTNLNSIIIPNNVTSIGNGAFKGCTTLTTVTIPNSVTSIGTNAFQDCTNLNSLTIPNSVTSIGYDAFYGCNCLTSIQVGVDNTIYNSRNNCNAIIKTSSGELLKGCNNTIIPNDVKIIYSNAFYKCSGLSTITIPNSVTAIHNNAFYGCSGLTSIVSEIEDPFTLGSSAFSGIASTCTLTVPYSTKDAYIAKGWTKDIFKGGIVEAPAPNITFADDNVKALCVANWDTNNDGELSEAEAAAITDLGTVFKNNTQITSFDELQYFTGLQFICNSAFSGCSNLTSVIIPNGIESIGDYAFFSCNSLNPLTFPNSITSIGNYAFEECHSLQTLIIPTSVTNIGISAFGYCEGLTSIKVEEGNPIYDSRDNCQAIIQKEQNTLITGCLNTNIPTTVRVIGQCAFRGCCGITSMNIPNNIIEIGGSAFMGCVNLETLVLPATIKSVGGNAFWDCNNLVSVVSERVNPVVLNSMSPTFSISYDYPNSLRRVLTVPYGTKDAYIAAGWTEDVFKGGIVEAPNIVNTQINGIYYDLNFSQKTAKVTIPPDNSTYSGTITIPEYVVYKNAQYTVTEIEQYAFYYASNLKSITIPQSVTAIGQETFMGCRRLSSISVASENTTFDSRDDCNAIIRTSDNTLLVGCNTTTIPNSVTSIAEYAFGGREYLTTISIPSNVQSISNNAFHLCTNLKTININSNYIVSKNRSISESLNSIFGTQLKNYVLGESVESIGEYAFAGDYGMMSIVIPKSVNTIGYAAFAGCDKLTSVTLDNNNSLFSLPNKTFKDVFGEQVTQCTIGPSITTIAEGTFNRCDNLLSVSIPDNITSIDWAFQNCSGLTSITIPNSVTSMDGAFEGCSGLTSVTIPENVTSMEYAFSLCSGLTSITIPNSVVSIDGAFQGCSDLTSVTIPENVTSIGMYTFANCSSLSSVTIPESVTSIGTDAFSNCSGLTSVSIPNSVTSIGNRAFYNCSGLTSVTIPENVTSIGMYTFSGCSSLSSVTIPESVTSIGYGAFYNCSGLTSVSIPNNVTSIETDAFRGCSGLTSVSIPNSVTSIGNSAFQGCSGLTSVTIPNSVTEINPYSFKNCTNLTSVVSEIKEPSDFCIYAFENISPTCTLTVPYGTRDAYIAKGWSESVFKGGIVEDVDKRQEQTMELTSLPTMTYGDDTYTLPTKTQEGFALTWASDDVSVSTISDNTLTVKGAGTATITASQAGDDDYKPFSKEFTLTVNKAPLTITAKSYTIKQGEALPTFEVDYSGFKNNETEEALTKKPIIACTATSGSAVGTYDITVSGSEAKNYDITFTKGTLTIAEADPVTVTAKSYTREYGETNPAFEYTSEGKTLEGTPEISCEATKSSPVGTYSIVVKKGTVANYNDSYVNGTLTITKAPLIITAKDCVVKQGEALPTFEVSYNGFKNDETEGVLTKAPVITCSATSANELGTFDITVSGAEAENYDISYVAGTFTVIDADAVVVTAKSYTREYGEANPTFEYTSEGKDLEGTPEISCEATKSSPVGTYSIVVKKGTVTNYNDSYVDGTLTITKAPLTITVKSYTIKQGEALPTFEVEYSGFKNNETEEALTKKPTIACTATSGSAVGTYDITVSGAEAKNYDITFTKGTLTIAEADPVTVTAKSYTREYGEANPTFEYTSEGKTLEGTPELSCEATKSSPVGTYSIVVKKGTVTNYNDSYVNGTLTITKAPLTITAKNYTIKQGEALPTFEVEYAGFKNNETEAVLTKKPTNACTATSKSAVGTYDITVSGAEAENYEISYVAGTLTITENEQALNNTLSVNAAEVYNGISKVVPVYMNNVENITALQFEVTLPRGVNLTKCQLTDRKGNDHAVSFKQLANGNYQVTVLSMSKTVFGGTTGALVNLTLSVDVAMQTGDYTMQLTNIELTTSKAQAINPADVSAALKVSKAKVGDVNGDGKVSITDAVAIVSYILREPVEGFIEAMADVNGDGNINVFDVRKVVNIILGVDVSETKRRSAKAGIIAAERLYIEDLELVQGETKTVDILLDNPDAAYSDLQFDLYLPEGITVAKNEAGKYMISKGSRCTEEHVAGLSYKDGHYVGMLYSMDVTPLSGNSGDVLTLTLKAADDAAIGSKTANFRNVFLSKTDATGPTYDEFSFGIIVKAPEQPVTVTANNLTMVYGDEVPELTYKSEGEELNGTLDLSTTATKSSPVGTYPITVTQGTVTNTKATYVGGTLTITKAPLTIGVQDVTITEGDAIPTFTLTYSGWKNSDTEATAFTTKPTATTTATATSKAGTYDIIVKGGTAKNYELSYTKGKLTILKKEEPEKPKLAGDANGDGTVNVFDVTAMVNYILGSPNEGFVFEAADVNGDGIVNVFDVTKVVNIILGVDDSEAKTRKAEGQSGTDKLYIEDFEIEPGEEKEVTILLDNPDAEYRDLQFDLYLPEGITVVQDEDEEFLVDTGSRCTKKHTIGFSYTDGHYVCMLYSTAKNPLSGNSGDILTITLKADGNVAPGAKTGSFRNVSLSKTDATGPTYDAFSFGFTVKGEVDAIEDVDAGAAPANKKIFRNGEIIIIRNGKEYDTNGKPAY